MGPNITDKQMLDWILSRGWVCRIRRKNPKPFENDVFLRVMDSREDVQRAMIDAGNYKFRRAARKANRRGGV